MISLTWLFLCPSEQWTHIQTDVFPSAPLESMHAPVGTWMWAEHRVLLCSSLQQYPTHIHTFVHTNTLALARDVLMFSMFSMLAMQLFGTLLHASRIYSQKLRCPSELNQLPEPGPNKAMNNFCSGSSHTVSKQPLQQYRRKKSCFRPMSVRYTADYFPNVPFTD